MVLEKFDRERKVVEFKEKAKDAKRDLVRVNASSRAGVAKAQSDLEAADATAATQARAYPRQ